MVQGNEYMKGMGGHLFLEGDTARLRQRLHTRGTIVYIDTQVLQVRRNKYCVCLQVRRNRYCVCLQVRRNKYCVCLQVRRNKYCVCLQVRCNKLHSSHHQLSVAVAAADQATRNPNESGQTSE